MHDRYGFDMRVAVGGFYERVAQAIYGGHSPSKMHTYYGINIDPDLTNGKWWREVKAMKTSERMHIRHLQLWRYLMLMEKTPGKRFHYIICRYRTEKPLKYYKQHMDELEPALARGLKMVIQLPFSVIFRIAMLEEDRELIYRPVGESIRHGDNKYYMTTWWQCGRVREVVDQGITALRIPCEQYTEHRFKCRLNGTESFDMLHVHEKRPLSAQRELLEEYDDDIGYFIDLENGIHETVSGADNDPAFAGDMQEELEMEETYGVPF